MKNKIVWLAEWNDGQDWEDNNTCFVGIYSTEEKANIAVKAFDKEQIELRNTYNPCNTSCHVYRIEVDK